MSRVGHKTPSLRSRASAATIDDGPFDDEEEIAIQDYQNNHRRAISYYRPRALGWFSVFCVIANRMIGSGIFRAPDVVIQETQSILAAMIFWGLGAIVTLAGAAVFVEFGLAIPQIVVDGRPRSVPANGGEKNYLEYVYHTPRRLATCLFGFAFICLGNMASNAILFAISIHVAATGRDPSNGSARGIAIGVAIFACFLHIYSRKLGIWLNNGFGTTKVLILLALIIIAIISFAGRFSNRTIDDAKDNYVNHSSFVDPPSGSYGYASSFLAIIFTYGGFNQANYILGNIRRPRRMFRWEVFSTVITICILYVCVNLCYYGITPYDQLINPKTSVAVSLIARTVSPSHAPRVMAGIQAFSSLGNIIIQTFTAARVKQEIAKEGVLPWSKFFAQNSNFTWLFWRRKHRAEQEAKGEATPIGALLLHGSFSVAMILATFALSPIDSYRVYVNLYSFTIDAIFGIAVGGGLLYLRIADYFKSGTKWSEISKENKWVSTAAALIFSIANLYPLIAVWFQPPKGQPQANKSTVPFWVTGTVSFGCIGCGLIYWVVFQYIYPYFADETLVVEKRSFVHKEDGELVVTNEIVAINWESK